MAEESGRALREPALALHVEPPSSGSLAPAGFDPARVARIVIDGRLAGKQSIEIVRAICALATKPARVDCEPMAAIEEGWSEWIHPLPGYLMQCCDCGLIHEMEFEIVPHGKKRKALNPGEGKRRGVIIFRARRHRDSGSDPEGGDALAAPGEASQSGGEAASPNLDHPLSGQK